VELMETYFKHIRSTIEKKVTASFIGSGINGNWSGKSSFTPTPTCPYRFLYRKWN
jgi:hypothetical protein